ncbi:MAG: AMP-binding protein [Oscillospiraceae bacterium]|nr:AMP-binding protein [Oscillospiraceae bacterium]
MKLSRLDALIREQEQVETLDRETIEAIQLKKLNRLLAREKERRGFYRDLPESLSSLSQLASLPFTTDEDLAHHTSGMLLTSQSEIQRVLSDATSGTTGAAKRVFYTEGDLENTIRLYMAGLGELIFPGSVTMICFPFSGPFGLGELIAEAVTRLGAKPLKLGPGLSYGEYQQVIEREQPDTFVGMPVQLLSILRFCGRGSLRRALVSGDACPDSVIRGCEEILGSRLFPHYGSREMGMAGAITCPAHEGMHLREHAVIAEIIGPDGQVLPHGELGELVTTTIGMEALPLIRYRTGDYTRILPEPCPCGSATIRLDRLQRRESGGIVVLDDALFSLEGLIDYRAERGNGVLNIHALTLQSLDEAQILCQVQSVFPQDEIHITCASAEAASRALYGGKRSLLSAP